jgi:hypothetical protein
MPPLMVDVWDALATGCNVDPCSRPATGRTADPTEHEN